MFGNPMEIALLVGAAVLLFGADRVPKLARGIGQASREFRAGQTETDLAHEREKTEHRAAAAATDAHVADAHAADVAYEQRAAKTELIEEAPNANGVIMGAPSTRLEPPAPRN